MKSKLISDTSLLILFFVAGCSSMRTGNEQERGEKINATNAAQKEADQIQYMEELAQLLRGSADTNIIDGSSGLGHPMGGSRGSAGYNESCKI